MPSMPVSWAPPPHRNPLGEGIAQAGSSIGQGLYERGQNRQRKDREKKRREFQTSEREAGQEYTAGENVKSRTHGTSEREAGEKFTAGENKKTRSQAATQAEAGRTHDVDMLNRRAQIRTNETEAQNAIIEEREQKAIKRQDAQIQMQQMTKLLDSMSMDPGAKAKASEMIARLYKLQTQDPRSTHGIINSLMNLFLGKNPLGGNVTNRSIDNDTAGPAAVQRNKQRAEAGGRLKPAQIYKFLGEKGHPLKPQAETPGQTRRLDSLFDNRDMINKGLVEYWGGGGSLDKPGYQEMVEAGAAVQAKINTARAFQAGVMFDVEPASKTDLKENYQALPPDLAEAYLEKYGHIFGYGPSPAAAPPPQKSQWPFNTGTFPNHPFP